ncbi:hypothetical protein NDU88_002968 [Pleurodeles waltl]|uniref:Uncharacterized protein n=1 Tax=Pleurodeles waltl TaxID=8319 RepID=A0AAV7TND5_PLEWA|nr:hypothetical protein NDU88_002968 [Pleurodeles waltl]
MIPMEHSMPRLTSKWRPPGGNRQERSVGFDSDSELSSPYLGNLIHAVCSPAPQSPGPNIESRPDPWRWDLWGSPGAAPCDNGPHAAALGSALKTADEGQCGPVVLHNRAVTDRSHPRRTPGTVMPLERSST